MNTSQQHYIVVMGKEMKFELQWKVTAVMCEVGFETPRGMADYYSFTGFRRVEKKAYGSSKDKNCEQLN